MENLEKEVQKEIGEAHRKVTQRPIKNIYIDWRTMQDFNIGKVLHFVKDEEAYQYFLRMLPSYEERRHDDIINQFPSLNLKTSEINNLFNSKVGNSFVLHSSPITEFFNRWLTIAGTIYSQNGQSKETHTQPIHIWLDFPGFYITGDIIRKWKTWAYDLFGKCKITFMSKGTDKVRQGFFNKMDLMAIYDMNTFLSRSDVHKEMNSGKWLEKIVYGAPLVDPKILSPIDKEFEETFDASVALISAVCDFSIITLKLIGDK